jgi:hypothetical protein
MVHESHAASLQIQHSVITTKGRIQTVEGVAAETRIVHKIDQWSSCPLSRMRA